MERRCDEGCLPLDHWEKRGFSLSLFPSDDRVRMSAFFFGGGSSKDRKKENSRILPLFPRIGNNLSLRNLSDDKSLAPLRRSFPSDYFRLLYPLIALTVPNGTGEGKE